MIPRWFDFLKEVIKEEPVVVRGALAFGLKAIAQAMHKLSLIETHWESGPVDGLGAMVGAFWCAGEAAKSGALLGELDLMRGIQDYNEVDCKVMMETVRYLRPNPLKAGSTEEPRIEPDLRLLLMLFYQSY